MNKLSTFKQLHHQPGVLFLANAWDVVSALILAQAGFQAIATTSRGMANAMGKNDGECMGFDQLLAVAAEMVAAVEIPVSVDIEAGYSSDPAVIAEQVLKVADLGAAGINIEDSLKAEPGLRETTRHGSLISRIRKVLDSHGFGDFFINARTDTYLQLEQPLAETLQRGQVYHECGADGLFVPGLHRENEIAEIVTQVALPLNVMSLPQITAVARIQALGVKRFSIGNALSDSMIAHVEHQARAILSREDTAILYGHATLQTSFR